jgi:hypothetical protein
VPLRRSVPLPRGLPPKRIVPVRGKRSRPRRGPDRSPEYHCSFWKHCEEEFGGRVRSS